MGQCKSYPLNIPRIYRFQALDHIMFGYIQGLRKALPSMTVIQAIQEFQKSFGIEDEDYCIETMKAVYYRIINALIDSQKTEKDVIL